MCKQSVVKLNLGLFSNFLMNFIIQVSASLRENIALKYNKAEYIINKMHLVWKYCNQPLNQLSMFHAIRNWVQHGCILTKFRRSDAKPDFLYIFTDIVPTMCFSLQLKIDWIWVGLGNFKGENYTNLGDKSCNIFQKCRLLWRNGERTVMLHSRM